MKKVIFVVKIILISAILLNPMVLFCQNWIRTYDTTTFIQSVIPLNDGGFLAIGHNRNNVLIPIDSFYLLRMDKNGKLIKARVWRINQLPLVQQVEDSSFLFVLSSTNYDKPLTIVKFSFDLDSIWSKTIFQITGGSSTATRFKKLSDGNWGLSANLYQDTACFFRLNSAGNILSTIKIGTFTFSGKNSGILDFFEDNNRDLTLITYAYQSRALIYFVKVNSMGEILSAINTNIESSIFKSYKTKDGNYLVVWYNSIVKIRADGTTIWERQDRSTYSTWDSALPLDDGSFILVRTAEPLDSIYQYRFFKLKENGRIDTLCSIPLEIGRFIYGMWTVFKDKDNKIVYSGFALDTTINKYRGFIAKTDLNSCSLSSVFESNTQSSFFVYPNPITDNAIIEIDSKKLLKTPSLFLLFDISGCLVKTDKFGGDKYDFQRQRLNNGLYIFQIKNNGQTVAIGKLILN